MHGPLLDRLTPIFRDREDLSSAGFEIKNPNATAKCGCGNSFSVAF